MINFIDVQAREEHRAGLREAAGFDRPPARGQNGGPEVPSPRAQFLEGFHTHAEDQLPHPKTVIGGTADPRG